jgi:hypothetical protein
VKLERRARVVTLARRAAPPPHGGVDGLPPQARSGSGCSRGRGSTTPSRSATGPARAPSWRRCCGSRARSRRRRRRSVAEERRRPREQILDHEMLRLLRRPNPFFSGRVLWMATITDWNVDGNAYWLKIRDAAARCASSGGRRVDDRAEGRRATFITHYEYRPAAIRRRARSRSTTSSTSGSASTRRPRKGYSPLKSVLREVFTDDEAANFTASLLRTWASRASSSAPKGRRRSRATPRRRRRTSRRTSPATSAARRS